MTQPPGLQDLPRYPGPAWDPRPARSSTTSTPAVLSMTFGLLGFVLPGFVLGVVALRRIRWTGEQGRGMAVTGLVASGVWTAFLLLTGIGHVVGEVTGAADSSGTVAADVPARAVDHLLVGDCFLDPEGVLDGAAVPVTTVEVVGCGEKHTAEAYARFWLEGLEYPGDAEVASLATAGCVERFEGFVGVPHGGSELDAVAIHPLQQDWISDRSVTCVLVEPDGAPLADSMANANR